ncbi:MAG: iron hydrogenase small subunit [Lachnospiraceae bacterium]|nr:iron hydrogenase small subunit [Lachnospiraceae bacterium]
MKMVNVKINGIPVSVPEGTTILDAAHKAGVKIPTLCFLRDTNEVGDCRICLVESTKARGLVAACMYPLAASDEGAEIKTNSAKVLDSRRKTLQLILSTHDRKCLSCVRSGKCELQKLCNELGVEDEKLYEGFRPEYEKDTSAVHMVRDNNKCVLCRRCVGACEKVQGIAVIGPNNRGFASCIGSAFDMGLAETSCIHCGQCIVACPTGALYEKDDTYKVEEALADPEKIVVVQPAPSVRATLGEEFGMPIGTDVEGKLATALRALGFDKVFDTDFAADLTIVEEATELVERVKNGGVLPMITSCSPGWVKFCETYYPDQIAHLSSCKSPQQMFGATVKTYYAQKMGIDPAKIVCVGVMPCTAKKFEVTRDQSAVPGIPDVDISITTRELARMIKRNDIDFAALPDGEFDDPLGESTGAAVIFGATGGVMEAALRTAVEVITGEELKAVDFTEVRGMQGIKEATYKVGGLEVKVAVASSLSNARIIMDQIKAGTSPYTFIEIMACPGGCINGGGQPLVDSEVRNFVDVRGLRAKALYDNDAAKTLRKSHENPSIKKVYEEFFGEFGSHKAHEILHTKYVKRSING